MTSKTTKRKVLKIRTEEQRRAIGSPLRMELISLFTERRPLSVAQMAERMGRPATAMHYHVRVLEKAGLLRRAGQDRSGRRPETLFVPAADLFMLEHDKGEMDPEAAIKTLSMAFRLAVTDMKYALDNPSTRSEGGQRNFFGMRLHCRMSKKQLAELNRQLRDIEKTLTRLRKTQTPSPDDIFISLTLALMPLRNREVQS